MELTIGLAILLAVLLFRRGARSPTLHLALAVALLVTIVLSTRARRHLRAVP